ncbi:MAG: single-stranded DNA-binding protein [bacterium]|nr:single-stranded DNA-binding protein [bacterium]
MASYNCCSFIGNLGRQFSGEERSPQDTLKAKLTSNEKKVLNVGLAVNGRKRDDRGEWVEDTTWIELEFWERLAAVVEERCRPGTCVFVSGTMRFSSYVSKRHGGAAVPTFTLRVRDLQILTWESREETSAPIEENVSSKDNGKEIEDLPF